MDDVEHVIRRRAYELSEQAGCFEGRSDEFWHAARAAVSALCRGLPRGITPVHLKLQLRPRGGFGSAAGARRARRV